MHEIGMHKHMGKNLPNPEFWIQRKMHGKDIHHGLWHYLGCQKQDDIDDNQVFYGIGNSIHVEVLIISKSFVNMMHIAMQCCKDTKKPYILINLFFCLYFL